MSVITKNTMAYDKISSNKPFCINVDLPNSYLPGPGSWLCSFKRNHCRNTSQHIERDDSFHNKFVSPWNEIGQVRDLTSYLGFSHNVFKSRFPKGLWMLQKCCIASCIYVTCFEAMMIMVIFNPFPNKPWFYRLPKLWIWKSTNFVVWERVKDIFHVKHNYV